MSTPDEDYFRLNSGKWVLNLDTFLVSCSDIFFTSGFKSIVDSEYFEPAPCLCCFAVKSITDARKVAKLFDTLLSYYEPAKSANEISSDEIEMLKTTQRMEDNVNVKLVELNKKIENVYITQPRCKPNVLWIYANHESRRFLKNILANQQFETKLTTRALKIDSETPELSTPIQWPYYPCYELYIKFTLKTINIIDLVYAFLESS